MLVLLREDVQHICDALEFATDATHLSSAIDAAAGVVSEELIQQAKRRLLVIQELEFAMVGSDARRLSSAIDAVAGFVPEELIQQAKRRLLVIQELESAMVGSDAR